MGDFIRNRAKEGSTVRAVIWCFGAFGVYHFSGDQTDAIVALTMALAGAGGLLPDKLNGR